MNPSLTTKNIVFGQGLISFICVLLMVDLCTPYGVKSLIPNNNLDWISAICYMLATIFFALYFGLSQREYMPIWKATIVTFINICVSFALGAVIYNLII